MGTPPAAHWHSSSKKPAAAWAASLAAATAVTLLLLSSRLWGGSGPSRAAEAVLRGGVQVPERPGAGRARAWLATYYAELQHSPGGTGNNCHAIALDCAAPGAPWTAAPPLAGERQPQPQQQQGLQPEQEKRYLVLAAVGDRWSPTANGWLDDPAAADFDLVVVYYGTNTTFACPLCLRVFRHPGPKPQVIHAAVSSPEWARLAAQRSWHYVWLPDDDIAAPTCTVTRFLRTMEANQLLLAQMSVCHAANSSVLVPSLHQRPGGALRFTQFVEIMAPAFRYDFWDAVVRPSLADSFTGHGLDSVWPFLLGFPHNSVAVVDALCMTHMGRVGRQSGKPSATSIYAAADAASSHAPGMEASDVMREWGATEAAMAAAGVPGKLADRIFVEHSTVELSAPAAAAPPSAAHIERAGKAAGCDGARGED